MKTLLIILSLFAISCNKKNEFSNRFVVLTPFSAIDTGGQITNHGSLYVDETYMTDTISLPEITGDTLIHLELNDSSYFEGIEITFDTLDADKLIIEYKR
jgi:hypothetical protein